MTVGAGRSRDFAFGRVAVPAAGYTFAGWALPGGRSCSGGPAGETCGLPAGSVTADATLGAAFAAAAATLTVTAGAGGSVRAAVAGAAELTVGAGRSRDFAFGAESTATLVAVPAAGYTFAGWALPGGRSCSGGPAGETCGLPAGSVTADATLGAAFAAAAATLTVTAGAGGSVRAAVAGAAELTVGAGRSRDFAFGAESTATLVAVPAAGYTFAGWALPGGRSCSGGPAGETCGLPAGSVTADATLGAAFAAAAATLTVTAGAGGSVRAAVAGAAELTVGAGRSRDFAFGAESTATLVAVPAAGYTFAGWALPGGRSCSGGPAGETCGLPAGSVTADATLGAAFAAAAATLTVTAGAGGSVRAAVAGAAELTVGAGRSRDFAFGAESTATLVAVPAAGYTFAGWALPGGRSCSGGPAGETCGLPAGSVTADATLGAAFAAAAATLTVTAGAGGSVRAAVAGAAELTVGAGRSRDFAFGAESTATLVAVPAAGYTFAGWALPGGRSCSGGPAGETCGLPAGSVTADATLGAAFAAAAATLTVTAGAGGSVRAAVAGAAELTVGAGRSRDFAFGAESTATLVAVPAAGYTFAGWALPGGRSCSGGPAGETCGLPAGSVTADATLGAAFAAAAATLTVTAGAGGSVRAAVAGAAELTVGAGRSRDFAFGAESTATLVAVPAAGYTFAGWALPGGRSCSGGPAGETCGLPAGSVTADATLGAAFAAAAATLTVTAGAGGSVRAAVAGAAELTVGAGRSRDFAFGAESTATLVAVPAAGYTFAGWALPGGRSCSGGPAGETCGLPAGSVTADATLGAAFAAAAATLTVTAGAGGSVRAAVAGAAELTVGAGRSRDFAFGAESTATLVAVPAAGYTFAGWALPGGRSCSGGPAGETCGLPAGSVTADATLGAAFAAAAATLTVTAGAGGSVRAAVAGAAELTVGAGRSRDFAFGAESTATLVAVPAAGYTFAGWALPGGRSCSGGPAGETCGLPAGSVTADATLGAAFAAAAATLTVTAGAGGSVRAAVAGAAELTVGAGRSRDFAFGAESTATLVAVPAAGYTFAGWALPGGRSCSGGPAGETCGLPAGSVTADATLGAAFAAAAATLTVTAGAGGSVRAAVAGAAELTVGAGRSRDFAFGAESTATLVAVPAAGYTFAGWALPGGRSCSGGPAGETCGLPAGSVTADATLGAAFAAAAATLTVTAGAGGSVRAAVAGAAELTVGAGRSRDFAFGAESTATLVAVPAAGYTFAGWALPGGRSCSGGPAGETCGLPAGSVTADATLGAAFAAAAATLTVTAGAGGSVRAAVAGAAELTVGAGRSRDFAFGAESTATLVAVPAAGYTFAGWALPGGRSCSGGPAGETCGLPAGSVTADATLGAAFRVPVRALAWEGPGSVSVSVDGNSLTATPYEQDAFVDWKGGPANGCDGMKGLDCDLSRAADRDSTPVAVFRPFVVAGVRSLAFGLGYAGDAPDHFSVSLESAPGTGFSPVPGLEGLAPAPNPGLERLAVSVHLLPWGRGGYLTEACDGEGLCDAALGGGQTLAQADSVAATGYFKAPVAGAGDGFGAALALSADGSTLAVGAPQEDSASTGAFAPGDPGYQAALGSGGTSDSGAVTVHRRSTLTGAWALEAFVKAPVADAGDHFGAAVALSADGSTLAVGAGVSDTGGHEHGEDSSFTSTFAPGGDGYDDALDSDGALAGDGSCDGDLSGNSCDSGAVYVYRRSTLTEIWAVEAFVKAPVAGAGDLFGATLALSDDGSTLAVGAKKEDSASTGAFAPGGVGYDGALASNGARDSGAAYVYRRSTPAGAWAIEAFVKASNAGADDYFAIAIALSGDGSTLAAGASIEDSIVANSGAAYVYRRSGANAWAFEAFVKASNPGTSDYFGSAVALSGNGSVLAVGASGSGPGAAYVYRRSGANAWLPDAVVSAPADGARDGFGVAIEIGFGVAVALSGDGSALAVGASREGSGYSGVFVPGDDGDDGYAAALADHVRGGGVGAAYVHHRLAGDGWGLTAFVKAPNPDGPLSRELYGDGFGGALDLSGDGSTLAVGASGEDGAAGQLRPVSGRLSDSGNARRGSGAVYLY